MITKDDIRAYMQEILLLENEALELSTGARLSKTDVKKIRERISEKQKILAELMALIQ